MKHEMRAIVYVLFFWVLAVLMFGIDKMLTGQAMDAGGVMGCAAFATCIGLAVRVFKMEARDGK